MIMSILSGKGGTGKTTVAANLAYIAAKHSEGRVILVGADPASKSVEFLAQPEEAPEFGWVDFLTSENMHFEQVVMPSQLLPNLYVVFSSRDRILHGEFEDPNLVARKIAGFKKYMEKLNDLVIIDCPAGLAVDHLLYSLLFPAYLVTTTEALDIQGTRNFVETIKREALPYGIREPFKGLIVNLARSEEAARRVAERLGIKLLGYLPAAKEISSAHAQKKPICLAFPESEPCRKLYAIARRLGMVQAEEEAKPGFLELITRLFRR